MKNTKEFKIWPNSVKPAFTGIWPLAAGFKRYCKKPFVTADIGHGFHSIHIVTKGTIILMVDSVNVRKTLSEGDMFVIWPGYNYHYDAPSAGPGNQSELFWLRLGGENIEAYLESMGFTESRPYISARSPADVSDIFRSIYNMSLNYTDACDIKAVSLLYNLILYANYYKSVKTAVSKLIEQIKAFMELEMGSNYNIQQICDIFHISRSRLYMYFKAEVGITPLDYLANIRLSKACRMLESTDLTVSEIAQTCGFTGDHHMSRNFKRLLNTTPSGYRVRWKK